MYANPARAQLDERKLATHLAVLLLVRAGTALAYRVAQYNVMYHAPVHLLHRSTLLKVSSRLSLSPSLAPVAGTCN